MWRLSLVLLIPGLLAADERWVEIHSGPFHVLSAAGDKVARERMNELEQFRYTLGTVLGKPDMQTVWPVRVLIFRNGTPVPRIALGRDAYLTAINERSGFSAEQHKALTRLFLDQNTKRLPDDFERGLIELFSTIEVSGTHITLGTPPPAAERDRAWGRMHLLTVTPDYAGRTRVMFNNLEQDPEVGVAYRNAFQKTAPQLDKELDSYLTSAAFGTAAMSGRALSAARDFHVETADADTVRIAQADLLLATGAPGAEAAYSALHGPEAAEGLGILDLKSGNKAEALRLFNSSIESNSKDARAFYEAGLLEQDKSKASKDLAKAAELNPRWAEPPYQLALRDADLDRKSAYLKKATALDPRNVEYWKALAKTETEATRFIQAQRAWGGAEQAAATPAEREQIRKFRLELEGERADQEAAEHRRKAAEEAADLQRVKDASMAAIHAAEANARKQLNPDGTAPPVAMDWYDAPSGTKVEGVLQRFDCLGKQARLAVLSDGKLVQILVGEPDKIVLSGGGQTSLVCGAQKPARPVTVTYNPKPNKKLGTAGEAVSIEFH